MFRNWFKRVFRPKSTPRPRPRPSVEALEDRTTPSVLFTPRNGVPPVVPRVTSGGGPVLGASNYVHVNTVFWGSYWSTTAGQAYANQIENSINAMFRDS